MSIFDKAKEKAEELVDKVKDKLDGHADEAGAAAGDGSSGTSAVDGPKTIPSDGAVTPADVAETVNDPDLQHPEQGNQQ